jgi:PAS domain S-box-containing protein
VTYARTTHRNATVSLKSTPTSITAEPRACARQIETPAPKVSEIGELFNAFGSDHAHNLALILKYALEKVKGQFVVYHHFDFEGQEIITHQAIHSPKGFRRKGRLNGRICYEAFVTAGHPHLFLNDLRQSAYWESDPDLKRYELTAYIGCPVFIAGRIAGSLALYDHNPGDYGARQISYLAPLADIIAFIEERRRVENNLGRKLQREKMLSAICTHAVSTLDMEKFMADCLETIGLSMVADGVTLYYQEIKNMTFQKMPHWCIDAESGAGCRHDFSDLLSLPRVRDAVQRGDVFQCAHAGALAERKVKKFLKQQKVKALLLVPLYDEQTMYGVCCLCRSKQSRQWCGEDIAALNAAMKILVQKLNSWPMAHRLDESEALIYQLFQLAPAAIYRIDLKHHRILAVNEYLCGATGYTKEELLALNPMQLLTPDSQRLFLGRLQDIAAGKPVSDRAEFEAVTKKGDVEWGRFHFRHLYEGGRVTGANVVAYFFSEQKKASDALKDYQKNLESMVLARTADLAMANQALRDEIEQRVKTAEKLQASTERLKEANTAMGVLLDKRMEDHQHTEELIRLNLTELIDPYLTRLENGELRGSQKQLVDLIRVNLDEVVTSSMPELASKYYIFSPNELQVVNLIRKGKTTKEMARLLSLSTRTVESYRKSIRKKLELKNKKVNLRTYLLSL